MDVSYPDPIDHSILWYAPHTLVLGMSSKDDRKSMTDFFKNTRSDVFDLWRDPDLLIPRMLDFPCFLRILDYQAYKLIEPALIDHLNDEDPETLTPTVVYGANRDDLMDNIAIINGSRTLPNVLAGFYSLLIRNR